MSRHGGGLWGRRAGKRFRCATWRVGFSAIGLGLLLLTSATGTGQSAVLEFVEPSDGAVYSTLDEIPVALRALDANDVFLSAEVLVDGRVLGTALYCCPWCPCPNPPDGQETALRLPVPWNGEPPLPANPWRAWQPGHPGIFRLTAQATGRNGTVVETGPITVVVFDPHPRLQVGADGSVTIVLPEGSLVPGGFDLETSDDLRVWNRLGSFLPGAVAAFYYDQPPAGTLHRYYRAVRVPPRQGRGRGG